MKSIAVRWIPCAECLPQDLKHHVIFFDDDGVRWIAIGLYNTVRARWHGLADDVAPTHWLDGLEFPTEVSTQITL